MALHVIQPQVHVLALQDTKANSVSFHVTQEPMVSIVSTNATVKMAPGVILAMAAVPVPLAGLVLYVNSRVKQDSTDNIVTRHVDAFMDLVIILMARVLAQLAGKAPSVIHLVHMVPLDSNVNDNVCVRMELPVTL